MTSWALAATGVAFPFFSAVVGWLGVFLTGSDTSANALFGNLQVVTANALGLNPILMASVNSAAGVMGKMISVQSIAVAVAATGMTAADESRLFRFTIKHSVLLMVVMGIIFLGSWFAQSVTGRTAYNSEAVDHVEPKLSWIGYLGSAGFWEATLQNWQSEFLAVGSFAVLAIYLRQRGSPESKPVGAPHDATGIEG